MKKLFFGFLFIIFILCGCENAEEELKNEYLSMKSKLLNVSEFTSLDDIKFDISVSIDRVDVEKISYKVIINNAQEDMNNIQAILVHNYYVEDVFPSVGLFDEELNLKCNTDDEVVLSGDIKTDKDIDNLNLVLKLYIRYVDNNGNEKDIYYKTTK